MFGFCGFLIPVELVVQMGWLYDWDVMLTYSGSVSICPAGMMLVAQASGSQGMGG